MLRRGSGWCSKSLLSNRVPAGFKDSAATARLPPAPSFPIPHYLFHYSTISPTSLAIWLPEKRPNHCLDFAFASCLIFKGASHRWMRLQRNTRAARLDSSVDCFADGVALVACGKEKRGILSGSASAVCEGF